MDNKHSPLPWKFEDDTDQVNSSEDKPVIRACSVIDMGEEKHFIDWSDEDALFTLKAVNNHYQLVECVKELLEGFEVATRDRDWYIEDWKEEFEKAEQLLKKLNDE